MVFYTRRQQTVHEYLAGEETLNRQGLIWGAVLNEPAPGYTHQAIAPPNGRGIGATGSANTG